MKCISPEFNTIVEYFGSRVPHTLDDSQYESFADMRADWVRIGSIRINTEFSDGTIFGDPRINWLFRAWHDHCHLIVDGEFDADGERLAASEQIRQVNALTGLSESEKTLYARIINIEVNGQVDYYLAHNDFPPDQFEFFRGEWTRLYGEWKG